VALRPSDPLVAELLSARAVRERCHELLALAERDALTGFRVDRGPLDEVSEQVAALTRSRFPDLQVPFHSRWRHFEVAGQSRWHALCAGLDARERLRSSFDLAVVSVLLDAGAGAAWRYRDAATGTAFGRSEGLALASLQMFADGVFSSDPDQPLQADAAGLVSLDVDTLAAGFQVDADNPMVGLAGRRGLLERLGRTLAARPDVFGRASPRIAGLADQITAAGTRERASAASVLEAVLDGLGTIWPGRLCIGGVNLGDSWRHGAIVRADLSHQVLPLHKLSQWLSYSLVEPLQDAGVEVSGLDALTGLAEYRNGGLLIDAGVLVPRDTGVFQRSHPVDAELIVEWRGLTVALLDVLAPMVRTRLGVDADDLPLACVLEGGTWAAGRAAAARRSRSAAPPLEIDSDGTVF
jgi:hypothetical protein